MYRTLHIMAGADAGGISTVVVNYYQHMDRNRIHFDIALTGPQDGLNGQRLRQLGAVFFVLPMKSKGIKSFERALADILQKNHYDAIHVHENQTSYVALRIAKKCGVPNRIAHSHTSAPFFSVVGELKRLSGCMLNARYATCMIGCGQLAGERVFGKWNMKKPNAVVLPNAIDTKLFAFDEAVRRKMRRDLQIEDRFAIGMVGRLSTEKNHAYALHLIKKLHELTPDAMLILVGNGEENESICRIIEENDMNDYVKMLGRRSDMAELYQAFDVVIMPSMHEGFPIAAVEAMAAGLPVLLSSVITKELSFGSAVRYIDLNDDEKWLNTLMEFKGDSGRQARGSEVRDNGLDIRDTAKVLEKIYLEGIT